MKPKSLVPSECSADMKLLGFAFSECLFVTNGVPFAFLCHAGFVIRRNRLFGFVIRIIHVGAADYKSANKNYGGLQIRRDVGDGLGKMRVFI